MVALLTAAGVGAEMHVIDNAGHIEALLDQPTLQLALKFADRSLKGENRAQRAGPSSAPSDVATAGAGDAK